MSPLSRTAASWGMGSSVHSGAAHLPARGWSSGSAGERLRTRRGLGLHETAPDRVARQLHAVAHAELLEHVRAMAVDGLLADEEHLRDLLARVPLGDQLHDLELTRREWVVGYLVAPAGTVEVVADERLNRRRVEERLPAHGGPARLDQVAIGRRLQHVTGGACLEGLEEVLLVVVHRQDQRAQLRAATAELGGGLEAGHARHGHVKDREVDVVSERSLHGLGSVAGLRDDLEVRLCVEDELQATTHDRVVVGEEDLRLQRHGNDGRGPTNWPSVPSPGPERILRDPPTSIARSRMPARPVFESSRSSSSIPRPSSVTRRRKWS